LDSRTEMFCGVNLHRLFEGQGRADRVRAGGELVPTDTTDEAHIHGRVQRRGIAFRLENDTGWIGQDHHCPRLRERVANLVDDRRADVNHIAESVEESAESLV